MNNYKNILGVFFFIILFTIGICCASELIIPIYNTNENCSAPNTLWFIDTDEDNQYNVLFFSSCSPNQFAYNLKILSINPLSVNSSAFLTNGDFKTKDYFIEVFDSLRYKFSHKIHYDQVSKHAILEDITESDKNSLYSDEADNYFSTYISGSHIRLIKKTDIYIKAMKLCNIEGMVLDDKPVYDNQSEYYFDIFGQPAGMYFIWIQSSDKVFVKKIIYTP